MLSYSSARKRASRYWTVRLFAVGAVVVVAFVTACGITTPGDADRARLLDTRGRYVVGFEANIFVPCGETQGWWVASLDSVP